MYGKSGQAVQVSPNKQVVLAEDVRGATTFLLGGCRTASGIITEAERPRCVSLMEANRTEWYVHISGAEIFVNPEYDMADLPTFEMESSFILYVDTFYPNYYAFRPAFFTDWFVRAYPTGRLWAMPLMDTAEFKDSASFRVYDYNTSRKHLYFIVIIFIQWEIFSFEAHNTEAAAGFQRLRRCIHTRQIMV